MKIKAFYLYLFLITWTVFLSVIIKFTHFNTTGLGIILAFLTLIFLPGILLWRIIGKSAENLAAKLLYILGLSFSFYFTFNLASILIGLNLSQLIFITIFLNIILIVIALWRDQKKEYYFDISIIKNLSITDYIIYFIILISSFLAFLAINVKSNSLLGDGWFHLAILQKISSGNVLHSINLSAVKTEILNPIYSFPIWHILVGEFAKLINVSIFTALRQSILPLTILAFVVWYCFISLIFKNKYITYVVFLSFLLVFLKDNVFQYLVAIPSPDSLNRMLLMPMILGIIVNFLFNKKSPVALNVILISILGIFLGLIHFTQLIYLIVILIILGILLLIFKREKDILLKLLYIFAGLGLTLLPYSIAHSQQISNIIKGNSAVFNGDETIFDGTLGANIIYRLSILALPIIGLFFKKYPRLVLLWAISFTSIFIYWPYLGLRSYFLKYLGLIFTQRSLANIPHFIYFGFIIFLIIFGLNYLIVRFMKKFIWLANALIILIIILLPLIKSQVGNLIDNYIFNEKKFFYGPTFWLALALIICSTIIIYLIYRKKVFTLPGPFDKLNFIFLTIMIYLFLALPYFDNYTKVLVENKMGSIFSNRETTNASDLNYMGGQRTIDFFKSNSGQVFLTDNVTLSQMLLLYSNNFVAEYPYGKKNFTTSKNFYLNRDLDSSLTILDNLKVNYVIVLDSNQLSFFKENPDYFQNVFENHYFYQKPRDLYIFKYYP